MLKRIFWLSVVAAGFWLVLQWFRQRQDEFGGTMPEFAPARSYTPLSRTPEQAPPPATLPTPPATDHPSAPEAATLDELFADEPATSGPSAPETSEPATPAATLDELFAGEPAAPETSAPEPTGAAKPEPAAAPEAPLESEEIIGYCMRCRTKRPIKDPHEETTESGRRAARGTCPVCGTNMFIFLAASEDAGDEQGAAQ